MLTFGEGCDIIRGVRDKSRWLVRPLSTEKESEEFLCWSNRTG